MPCIHNRTRTLTATKRQRKNDREKNDLILFSALFNRLTWTTHLALSLYKFDVQHFCLKIDKNFSQNTHKTKQQKWSYLFQRDWSSFEWTDWAKRASCRTSEWESIQLFCNARTNRKYRPLLIYSISCIDDISHLKWMPFDTDKIAKIIVLFSQRNRTVHQVQLARTVSIVSMRHRGTELCWARINSFQVFFFN